MKNNTLDYQKTNLVEYIVTLADDQYIVLCSSRDKVYISVVRFENIPNTFYTSSQDGFLYHRVVSKTSRIICSELLEIL